jgi:hypothetical protein
MPRVFTHIVVLVSHGYLLNYFFTLAFKPT